MASPQVEHGYTRLANELLEQFESRAFTARQQAILWAVLRRTYGYNRKVAPLTARDLADATGLDIDNARKALRELTDAAVLDGQDGEVGPQKDHTRWGIPRRPRAVDLTGQDGRNNRPVKSTARSNQPVKDGQIDRATPVESTGPTHLEPANDAGAQEPKDMKDMKDMNPPTPKGEMEGLPFEGKPSTTLDADQAEHVEDTVRPVLSASLVVPSPLTPAAPPSAGDEEPEGFADFYALFPGPRKSRSRDRVAYARALKRKGVTPAMLLQAVKVQLELYPDWRDHSKAPMPATWLNQARWEWQPPSSLPSPSPGGPEVPASIAGEPWAVAIAPYLLPDGGISRGGLGSYCAKLELPGADAATCWTIAEAQGVRAAVVWAWERRVAR